MRKIIAIAWLACLSLSAQAEGFFVGGELATIGYPTWIDRINSNLISSGASYAYSEQKKGSIGLGIRGGQWLNDNFGWEIGYDDLGSIEGSTTATFGATTGTGKWKYSATAVHAAVLGGLKLGGGTLFGKLGIHNASTKLDGTYVFGGGAYSKSASGTGLMIGGGYSFPFTDRLSGRVALDIFNDVTFTDWRDFTKTTSESLAKLSFGVDYAF